MKKFLPLLLNLNFKKRIKIKKKIFLTIKIHFLKNLKDN